MTCSLEQGAFSQQAPPAHWPAASQQRVPYSEILKLKIVKVKFKNKQDPGHISGGDWVAAVKWRQGYLKLGRSWNQMPRFLDGSSTCMSKSPRIKSGVVRLGQWGRKRDPMS